ncbi:hypothetical protein EVAR_85823_1 [Eumeta japonica]|uniref:Uncharacterized protein n=1 Tax=Eumeta variegata TaxID=151549 RepID=A0A4C1US27_EUMVA|nr:hypothetical protein EVAR_85823_1 [Eumeta japonica]
MTPRRDRFFPAPIPRKGESRRGAGVARPAAARRHRPTGAPGCGKRSYLYILELITLSSLTHLNASSEIGSKSNLTQYRFDKRNPLRRSATCVRPATPSACGRDVHQAPSQQTNQVLRLLNRYRKGTINPLRDCRVDIARALPKRSPA